MSSLQPVFGARVRLARKRQGFTQVEAARRVGLVPEAYGRIERGEALLRVSKLRQLCHALSVSADVLLQPARRGRAAHPGPLSAAPATPREAEVQRLLALLHAWPLHRLRMLVRVVRTLDAAYTGRHPQRPEASRVDTSSSR